MGRCRSNSRDGGGGVRWGLLLNLLNVIALCALLVANLRSIGGGGTPPVGSLRDSRYVNATTKRLTNDDVKSVNPTTNRSTREGAQFMNTTTNARPGDAQLTNATTDGSTGDRGCECIHTFTLSDGAWSPPIDFLDKEPNHDFERQEAINAELFNSTSPAEIADVHSSFLGFMRVSKTGSTSVLKFLQKNMHSGTKYMLRTTEFDAATDKVQRKTILTCVFGPPLGISPHVDWGFENCPHLRYHQLVGEWANILPFWGPPEGHPFMAAAKHQVLSMSLETFTIIRDPFDRLVSYFFFVKYKAPGWKNMNTEAQNERIKAGDLAGWMELLYTEDGSLGMGIPYQYDYFSSDVDRAISLIQGDSPRILTLINECFSTSVRLLVEKKNMFFSPGSADDFLKSSTRENHSRNNKASYKGITERTLLLLRQNATEWFADDYKFYHAAVEQFRRHLASSSLKPSELSTCKYWDKDAMKMTEFINGGLRNR